MFLGTYLYFGATSPLHILFDTEMLKSYVLELGIWGPVAVVVLMTLAIVFAPLPSAPIALVAGAVYGHLWGTIYVLIGAEFGAIIAFTIARFFGHGVLSKWVDSEELSKRFLGSQSLIMGIVFVSRLLPFISFDLVSYAAGLSSITFLRFAIATLAGIIPASFLLTHFGEGLSIFDTKEILILIVFFGFIMFLPLLLKTIKKRTKS